MPLYEYVCSKCGCKFELLRPISQSNEAAPCPSCHHEAERVLSPFTSLSKDSSGLTTPVGGSSCSSCSAASCNSCNL
jgi:putative FmdB family regulatory protein